jgi:microcystin-dependent protein
MLGLKNRGSLPAITEDEFDHLVAQIKGLFLVEHNEDGSHITQDRELSFVPIGAEMAWKKATPPTGWLFQDGSAINRLTYQGLFNHYGTTYGAGDGSTTFNLPDMRGRFFLGKTAAGTGSVLGGTGGAIDHIHTGASHTHGFASHTHTIGASGTHAHTAGTLAGPSHTHGPGTYDTASHNHGGSTGGPSSTDSCRDNDGGATENPGSSDHDHSISSSSPAVDAGVSGSCGTGAVTGSTGADGNHDHGGVTGGSAGTTDAGGTGNTGAENPPFMAGNWIVFAGVA